MELSDRAYSTIGILKRFTPLMNGLDDATDGDILEVCQEIVEYLSEIGG